jgi:hypothetical protein
MSNVRRSALGRRTLIKSGGFGKVYRVDGFWLPGGRMALAYKEYTCDVAEQGCAARQAVEFWQHLDEKDRAVLGELTVWPRAIVEDDRGQICGVLMPLLPDDFFIELADASSGHRQKKPRELAWLATGRRQRVAAGLREPDVEFDDRLVLLGLLAYALAWLHRRGWVYGDLNFQNVAFTAGPPRIRLLDCDNAAPLSDLGRRQGHALRWEPPECRANLGGANTLQDNVTDVYKLGLAVLRCLSKEKHATTIMSPGSLKQVLDPSGFDLVRRALSDREQRPAAKELYSYLRETALARMGPPEVIHVAMAADQALRGQDLRIDWLVTRADEAVITSGNSHMERLDLGTHSTGYAIRPDTSGPVAVEFRNSFASVTVDLGELRLYELPPVWLPAKFLLPDVTLNLTDAPVPSLPDFGIPGLPPVDVRDLLERAGGAGSMTRLWEGLDAAVAGVLAGVSADAARGGGHHDPVSQPVDRAEGCDDDE